MKKAIIAMSGGVDSSVAALLVKEKGLKCMGVTMQLHTSNNLCDKEKSCLTSQDIEDARCVASKLGMPYHVFDFLDDFKTEVIDRFIKSYELGLTPNPCIDCNRYIKWKKLFDYAKESNYEYVVTGHYARIEYDEKTDRYLLKKGVDESKDQSYVLYNMTQEQLSHTLLPLGALPKLEVRKIAEENGFINAIKPDSQDICFVPDGDYAAFIENTTGLKYPSGKFTDKYGNILGEHKGLIRYTVGQRKGLGLALKKPQYVLKKDIETNTVILGDNEDLFTREFIVDNFNWVSVPVQTESFKANVKTRYKHLEQPAEVIPISENKIKIIYEQPQRAITEGQAAVVYDGDTVVGGGTIIETQYNI